MKILHHFLMLLFAVTAAAQNQSDSAIRSSMFSQVVTNLIVSGDKDDNAIRTSSILAIHNTTNYGTFIVVYADMRDANHPYGIRGTGGNGQNFVFHIAEGKEPLLVYRNYTDEMENRLTIIEITNNLIMESYAHAGLTGGQPEPTVFVWNGTRFDRKGR